MSREGESWLWDRNFHMKFDSLVQLILLSKAGALQRKVRCSIVSAFASRSVDADAYPASAVIRGQGTYRRSSTQAKSSLEQKEEKRSVQ
jgi:hypothetical protein